MTEITLGKTPVHSYSMPNTCIFELTVTDNNGVQSSETKIIEVMENIPPIPVIPEPKTAKVGGPVRALKF